MGYSIQSGVEKLPLSAPGLLVASSPEGHLDARAINALAPSLKVDIITTESAVSQYLFLLELSHCAPNGGSSGIRAGSTSIKFYPGTTVGRHRTPTNHPRGGFPLHDTLTLFPLSSQSVLESYMEQRERFRKIWRYIGVNTKVQVKVQVVTLSDWLDTGISTRSKFRGGLWQTLRAHGDKPWMSPNHHAYVQLTESRRQSIFHRACAGISVLVSSLPRARAGPTRGSVRPLATHFGYQPVPPFVMAMITVIGLAHPCAH